MASPTLAHHAKSQYDADSAPNENYNCGPTTVVNSIRYMRGVAFRINDTRRLATTQNGRGTHLSERKTMYDKRGVPADVTHLSYADLKKRLDGSRTCDVALLMAKIPLSIRKRPFAGSHSVEGLCNAVVGGVSGIYVNNPDYHDERGQQALLFIPDRYAKEAFDALGGWAVVPAKARVSPTRVSYRKALVTTGSVNARSGPGVDFSVVNTFSRGTRFTSAQVEKAGGWYLNHTRRDWVSRSYNGRTVWLARAYVKEV